MCKYTFMCNSRQCMYTHVEAKDALLAKHPDVSATVSPH